MGVPAVQRIDVVLPTFNEASSVGRVVSRLLGLGTGSSPPADPRVLIVDDESPDGTGAIADELATAHPERVRVLHRSGGRGLGRAYLAGFEFLLRDPDVAWIAQMDADLSHAPEVLPRMLEAMQADALDLVMGSRYIAGGSIEPEWAAHRLWLSSAANRAVVPRWLGIPCSDATGGYRLWRREALERIDPVRRVRSGGYGFQVEMAYLGWMLGLRFGEVPIHFADREAGRSKMGPLVKLRAIADILAMRWRHRRLLTAAPHRSAPGKP